MLHWSFNLSYDVLVIGPDKRLTNMRLELTTTSQSELIDIMILYILSKLTVTERRLLTLGKYYLISHLLIHNFSSNPSNLRTFEITLTYMI